MKNEKVINRRKFDEAIKPPVDKECPELKLCKNVTQKSLDYDCDVCIIEEERKRENKSSAYG